MTFNEYECPNPECGEWIAAYADQVTCTGCGKLLAVNWDADWDAGGWHDRTTLSLAKENR